jgi:hypothetical protein
MPYASSFTHRFSLSHSSLTSASQRQEFDVLTANEDIRVKHVFYKLITQFNDGAAARLELWAGEDGTPDVDAYIKAGVRVDSTVAVGYIGTGPDDKGAAMNGFGDAVLPAGDSVTVTFDSNVVNVDAYTAGEIEVIVGYERLK